MPTPDNEGYWRNRFEDIEKRITAMEREAGIRAQALREVVDGQDDKRKRERTTDRQFVESALDQIREQMKSLAEAVTVAMDRKRPLFGANRNRWLRCIAEELEGIRKEMVRGYGRSIL